MKDKSDIFFEIVDFVNRAKITRFCDLVRISFENGYEDWIDFLIEHSDIILKYISSKNA